MARPWVRAVLFALLVVLFLVVNRGAYQGYFFGDDLDNVFWTPYVSLARFAGELATPRLSPSNFRPIGHLYFRTLANTAGLNYPWYVAVIQAFHLLNVWLLYVLLGRLRLKFAPAAAGALFFSFEAAALEAWWKPMYAFDVLSATLCLLCLICYAKKRYVWSFVCFWLAFKTKELAIVLPVLLAAWEWWMGERRWKRVVPFFAVSLVFGVQALFRRDPGPDYRLDLSPRALWTTISFYSSKVFFLPFAGLATIALPFLFRRDRRVWLGVAGFWLLLAPVLLLPLRLFPAYLYVPLAALSIAGAAMAAGRSILVPALFFALWLPVNHWQMRVGRKATLAAADENRRYLDSLARYFRANPAPGAVVIDGDPDALHRYGTEAAVRLASGQPKILMRHAGDQDARQALDRPDVLVASWNQDLRRVDLIQRRPDDPPVSWIEMGPYTPVWVLREGWYARNGFFRWIEPRASASLYRPEEARAFVLRVNAGPALLEKVGASQVELFLDGRPLGGRTFTRPGVQGTSWDLPPGPAGDRLVEFHVTPELPGPAGTPRLGIAIVAFGFVAK